MANGNTFLTFVLLEDGDPREPIKARGYEGCLQSICRPLSISDEDGESLIWAIVEEAEEFGIIEAVAKMVHEDGMYTYAARDTLDVASFIVVFSIKYLTDRSDVWALGCVVVETLIGRPPCDGLKDAVQVWSRIVQARQLPFSEWAEVPSRARRSQSKHSRSTRQNASTQCTSWKV